MRRAPVPEMDWVTATWSGVEQPGVKLYGRVTHSTLLQGDAFSSVGQESGVPGELGETSNWEVLLVGKASKDDFLGL